MRRLITFTIDLVLRLAIIAGLVAAATVLARAQGPTGPDQRGEAITGPPPVYQGSRAVPVLPEFAVRNEGGSDGAGLCVIASITANGIYQGVPGLATPGRDERSGQPAPGKGSPLWRAAKSQPGGYYPEKLQRLVNQTNPNEKWASYYGRDTTTLDQFSRQGYPIGATMSTGRQYGYQKIAHMISLLFYRKGGYACVLDNNFPSVYSWMPASEFDRRWTDDGGNGWAWVWLRRRVQQRASGYLVLIAAALAAVVIVAARNRAGGPS